MRTKWFLVALTVLCATILAINLRNRPVAELPNPVAPQQAAAHLPPAPVVAEAPPAPAEPVALATEPIQADKPAVEPASAPQKPPKEPLHDPEARDALALVGTDPDAEAYWLDAIYDTSLPDNEREDLMEDLNEVGFADPKNLTPDDLPLIVSRLQLIEDIAPNTDPFMARHLGEAYKDLRNMFDHVTQ